MRLLRSVSVLVPTCNRPNLLDHAIASISRQSRPELVGEVIISNNGESDVSDIINHYPNLPIRLVKQEPVLEPGENFRWLVSNAKFDWLAMLADDDMWGRYHLEEADRLLTTSLDAIAVFNQTVAVSNSFRQPLAGYAQLAHSFITSDAGSLPDAHEFPTCGLLIDALIRTPLNVWSMVALQSTVLKHIGVFAEQNCGIDADRLFVWRLSTEGKILASREIGLFMRCHPGATGTVLEKKDGTKFSEISRHYSRQIIIEAEDRGLPVADTWRAFWESIEPEKQTMILRQSYCDCVAFASDTLGGGPYAAMKRLNLRSRLVRNAKDWLPPVLTRKLIQFRNRSRV